MLFCCTFLSKKGRNWLKMSYIKLKNKIVKIFIVMAAVILSEFSGKICLASGDIPRDYYALPVGKSVLMNRTSTPDQCLEWKSEDTDIAVVDSWGVVHAKSIGKTNIIAVNKRNKKRSSCCLEVKESEPFKNVITSLNIAGINESFDIKAYATKNVSEVKFNIQASGFNQTIQCKNKRDEKDFCIWTQSVKIPKCGECKIEALGKINGSWKSCHEGISEIYISNEYKNQDSTLSEKRASSKCSDFIVSCEGFVSKVYKDRAGILTIGCGKKIHPFEPFYDNLSWEEGAALASRFLSCGNCTKLINKFLMQNNIKCRQNQFDALVSFSYNLGSSWAFKSGNELRNILLDCARGDAERPYGIVNSGNGLYVRSSPSTSSKKLCALINNSRVELLDKNKKNGKWYHVRTQNGIVGYCFGDYLKVYSEKSGEKNLDNVDRNRFISEFLRYHHVKKKCNQGLLKRRCEELDIFFRSIYSRNTGLRGVGNYPIPRCML